jgi:hypothetical protein
MIIFQNETLDLVESTQLKKNHSYLTKINTKHVMCLGNYKYF